MKSLFFSLALLISTSVTAQESRIALVIGNANYEKGKLKNPVNDALLMQNTFQNLGFDVILDTNITTRDHFYKTISTFLDKRMKYDVAFIYYAGHAVQIGGDNYMLATKEAYNSERDAKNLGININAFIEDYQDPVANKINVLIIDACRNNPFEQSWTPQNRSLENGLGLAEMKNLPTGTIIAYSTQPGYTASDGKDKNSLYCLSLAQNFMVEGVRIEDVFAKVKKEVRIASSEKQKPTYTNDLEGTAFYLKKTDLTNQIIEVDSLIDAGNISSFNAAREKISALLALHPNDKRCLLRKGRLELYNEDIQYDGSDLFKADKLFPNDSEVKQFLARYYKSKKEFEKALKEINSSISLDADNPESYNWKIRILLESGDTTNALECYSKIIDLERNNPKRYEYRADYFIEKGDFANALMDLNKSIQLAPTEAYFYEIRADFFIQQEEITNALKDLDKTIELSPTAYYHSNRADFYKNNINDNEKAIKDYVIAIQLTSEPYQKSRALNNLGLVYHDLEKYNLAIESYSKAIELSPEIWNSYSNRADSYSKLDKFELALQDYTKAIELDKEDPAYQFENRANFYIQQEDNINALKDLDKAIELSPTAYYYSNRADFYKDNLYDNEKAIKDYEKAIQLTSETFQKSRALNNLGLVYHDLKKYDLAIESYSKAIELSPEIWNSYSNRADSYSKLEKFDLALQDYTKAIELDLENQADRLNNRADFFIKQKENTKALKDLDKTIELSPTAYYYNNRADFYKDNFNDNEKAIKDYEKSIQLTSEPFQKSRALNNLGMVYHDLEKYELAIETYSKAIELSPEIWNSYSNRAYSYMKLKKYDLALQDFTKAIEIDKEEPGYQLNNRAEFYRELEEYEKSLIDISRSIELDPENIEWIFFRADLYDQYLNQNQLAEQDYQKILKIDSTNITSMRLLGTILEENQKFKDAMALYNKALKVKGVDSTELSFCYFNRSLLNLKFNQIDSALTDISHAIEINSIEPDFYYIKADIHFMYKANYNESLFNISKAIELESENTELLKFKARIFYEQNDYKRAIEIISLALEYDRQNPDLLCKRGILWSKMKNFKNAELDFLNAQKNEVSVQNTKLYLSKYYSLNQKTGNYIDLLYDLIQIDPMDPEPYYLLGEYYASIDDNTKASIYYATAITRLELSDYYISDTYGNEIDNSVIYAVIGDFCKSLNENDLMYVFYEKALDYASWNYELNICKLREDISKKLNESCGSECKIIQQE